MKSDARIVRLAADCATASRLLFDRPAIAHGRFIDAVPARSTCGADGLGAKPANKT
ncbi:MAG TPA: hypothetical protein VNR88_03745 [Hyphomicrobium sp.]|nr:hypothetical protein [Hyphomicrobium sp.]